MLFNRMRPEFQKAELGLVPYWSPSSLKQFERCPYATRLRYVEKVKEPGSQASERGTEIHEAAERFVRGEEELHRSLSKVKQSLERIKERYEEGIVLLEDPWAFDLEWNAVEWFADEVWLRVKLDAFIQESPTNAIIIDYKTGKKMGNELTHGEQAIIYAIAAFRKYPELELIDSEFIYTDEGKSTKKTFRRMQINIIEPRMISRAMAMTTCKDFIPNPSKSNCRFCYYRDAEICPYGVDV